MKNKNSVIILCSIVFGVIAAAVTAYIIIKKLSIRKKGLESTDLVFENSFDDEPAEDNAQYVISMEE